MRYGRETFEERSSGALPLAPTKPRAAVGRSPSLGVHHPALAAKLPFRPFFMTLDRAGFVLDGDAKVLEANAAAEKLIGRGRSELIGSLFGSFCRALPGKQDFVDGLTRGGEPRAFHGILEREGEGPRRVDLALSFPGQRPGSPVCCYVIMELERETGGRDTGSADSDAQTLRHALTSLIHAMTLTLESRDPCSAGHQRRVAELARAIAVEMGYSSKTVEGIAVAASIHDLGMIAVPTEILTKPGRITHIEYSLIKSHPKMGHDILKPVDFPWPIAQIVLQHHERLDGSGYPSGSRGEEILPEAMVIAVADTVEAMTTRRRYRKAHRLQNTLEEISRASGKLYPKAAVEACTSLFKEKRFRFKHPAGIAPGTSQR